MVAGALLVAYVYTPLGDWGPARLALRTAIVPVIIATGLLMWKLPALRGRARRRATTPATRNSDSPRSQPGAAVLPRRSTVVAAAHAGRTREPGIYTVGVAALVLAVVCLIGVALRGRDVAPEGKLMDAATFCFGVGVFTVTVAMLLPLAGYPPRARRWWRRSYYVFAVYGLALESIQALRGLDPRSPRKATSST